MKAELKVFDSPHALYDHTASVLRGWMTRPPPGAQLTGIMLSGGRTPQKVFSRLAGTSSTLHPKVMLFLSDERMVPFSSDQSNFGHVRPMLKAWAAGGEQLLPVHTELPLEDAAERFDRDLGQALLRGLRIGFGLLGLGTDGHTASLFTREDAARGGDELACAVRREDEPDRVSVTPALLRCVQRIRILAGGESKRSMIGRLMEDPDSIPAGRALHDHPDVEIWTEQRL
ncbi:6-phosphogluconolactonase [Kiritimatiella glycovorans]|uniref:6-phosphogluconolactonase n=1 Tax=Kiritimatiella glycovorans TaxID=1307763 RepID=A0A0G3EDG5_9BACT|nr:6-phosphogluconolactonase [Kiritimatiella glycovorans]AKJ64353.1 6-phosphogluconolactonase [Kiritimatiella glycovorans]